MPSTNDILAVILGGGVGRRLYPLTRQRAKPAVPIAGKYRLIDVPISNCINSNIHHIAVLTQGVVIRPFPRGTEIDAGSWAVQDGIVVIPKSTILHPGTTIGLE